MKHKNCHKIISLTKGPMIVVICLSLVVGIAGRAEAEILLNFGDFSNLLDASGENELWQGYPRNVSFLAGGHVSEHTPPTDPGEVKLVESSFGQMVANPVPYVGIEQTAIDLSRMMLYYEYGTRKPYEFGGRYDREKAAFRYKAQLYTVNADTGQLGREWCVKEIENLWTESERDRVNQAKNLIIAALRYNPKHEGLRNALLDIYYETAVAYLSVANKKLAEAQKSKFGFDGNISDFQISQEILFLEQAYDQYVQAIQPYFDLLQDDLEIDMSAVNDADDSTIPFGYHLFKTQVPSRSLYSSFYIDDAGEVQPVFEEEEVFNGYKDLVLLFQMERDAAQTAAKLARLYGLRSSAGDLDLARQLIGKAQQRAYTEGNVLSAIFPAADLANIDNNSGLVEARAGWAQGLSALSGVKSFVDGNASPLGLDENFLALVQTEVPGTSQTNLHKDSFDRFAELLIPGGADPAGALKVAWEKYTAAYQQYEKVQMFQDTIQRELAAQKDRFETRLFEICGVPPTNPEYNTPEDNEGSEINLQIHNITLAKHRIDHNTTEITNIQQQIEHEIERRGKEAGINDLIGQTQIDFGNKQSDLSSAIGGINAAQAAAQAIVNASYNAFESLGTSVVVGAVNAIIQAGGEVAKGVLQGKKEQFASQLEAEITYKNDQISAAESEARVKDLWLNMNILAIESLEAATVLAQEVGRLQALYDERDYLYARWQEAQANLATRYFANPAHRMLLNQYILEADFSFQDAQFWVYVLARALDYKRNTRVLAHSPSSSKTYSSTSVFALRNARELLDMAQALWNYDATQSIGDRQGMQFVRFSIREDALGFRKYDNVDQLAYYPDPQTGNRVTAEEAFRSYLQNVASHDAIYRYMQDYYDDVVHLEFSTAKEKMTFFSSFRWNEKIKWISVRIQANYPNAPNKEVMVYLEQSGTGFIRNAHPDQQGEMSAYPIQYWYQDGNGDWQSKDTFGFGINAVVNEDLNAPPDSDQKAEFHEMPPAVSTWVLEIPLRQGNTTHLDLKKVSDIEIWFYNYYYARN